MEKIKNYSIQVIAFAIILILIAFISSYITSEHKDREQKKVLKNYYKTLKKTEEYAQQTINKLHRQIQELEKQKKQDSTHIVSLTFKIKQDGVRMKQERKEASKFTTSEKTNWILNRYNSPSN